MQMRERLSCFAPDDKKKGVRLPDTPHPWPSPARGEGVLVILATEIKASGFVGFRKTLLVFSKWMNSRRSLDYGRIGILRHDQLEQHLQSFLTGQRAVILEISFVEGLKFSYKLFHKI